MTYFLLCSAFALVIYSFDFLSQVLKCGLRIINFLDLNVSR